MISIQEINFNIKSERQNFVEVPWKIYHQDNQNSETSSNWVPPLKMAVHELLQIDKHPFYQTAKIKGWIATKNNQPVGRIMAIYNKVLNHQRDQQLSSAEDIIGHFGFYESTDDFEVAQKLVETATDCLLEWGANKIQGPMNPSTNYECGFIVDHFNDPPQIMMTYNPPYYLSQFEKMGFSKAQDLLAYNVATDFTMPQIIMDIAKRTEEKKNVTFRSLNLKKWGEELDIMYDIYNSAWIENWGFIPMTKEEFYHTAKDLKSIVDPNLIQFAMVGGIEAGFILTLPDLNQVFKTIPHGKLTPISLFKILTAKKRINRVRVITLGVKKEFRKLGIETLLYKYNHIAIQKNPRIKNIEMSWILENNLEMNKPLIRMSGSPYKRYRILEKTLNINKTKENKENQI